MSNVIWFENLRMSDVGEVGGKNASLGEMISQLTDKGIRVPGGFATTADAYKRFLEENQLKQKIDALLVDLDVDNVIELAKAGKEIQNWIMQADFPQDFERDVESAYEQMIARYGTDISVAVRSSATAEDLPDASFAGQQDTFLNIRGVENLKSAIKQVFASLYNDRAIAYRVHKGFDHSLIYLSAGIQKMVRSDIGSSGVMFTVDTETGFDQAVFITSSYGLGECVVQGMVNPDEFYVYKPNLAKNKHPIIRKTVGSKAMKMEFTDANVPGKSVQTVVVPPEERYNFSILDHDVIELGKFAVIIEEHYGRPMDIEWGKDGNDGLIYILQARPETVKSQENNQGKQTRYHLRERSDVLVHGRAVGQKAATGIVRLVKDISEMSSVKAGDILVTDMTDPDWEPVMKRAAAIVTNRGGRTCHAAIIARELGIPAIVGCENATEVLQEGQEVTVSCCEGDTGHIYDGHLNIEVLQLDVSNMPELPVKIMMNVGNPELAFNFSMLPNSGVGLARLEFIINRQIGIHPKALLDFDSLPEPLKTTVADRIGGYPTPVDFYVDKLAEGIATIAAAFYPQKVIVRLSDFKSNEYSNLIGGKLYEPTEENPMMGFRGASRYIAPSFRDCFDLECMAINKVRKIMGFDNVTIMIPFVRTTMEAKEVINLLAENGLQRGVDGLNIYMMCEIPSNAILADQFLNYFDGFSIGSNDMTQLTLGIDRDSSGAIAASFDERNDAVKAMLHLAIQACRRQGKYIGICGQGPSDHADFAKWLIDEGIETISLNPDTVIDTWLYLHEHLTQNA